MGHVRLGQLLKTRPWIKVVELISTGADVSKVAEATMLASDKALKFVQQDAGFRESVYLLAQIGIAASKTDPVAHLASVGIVLPKNATVVDMALAISQGLERNINETGRRSDFGEKARGALVGAMTDHLQNRLGGLFIPSGDEVMSAFKGLHTSNAFGEFGRSFFAKLTNGCMEYFLTKTLGTHLGEGRAFRTMNQMSEFQRAMDTHCWESSKIVEGYCGDWFSKHRYEGGGDISKKSAEGFGWFALEKMRKEITFESDGAKGDGK
ncbi:MAG: hypothetical protein NTV49_01615 [Kiritimatiellaeota bacterium]|nr:hypothetical protein [Kiritimatiellota bacterium]